MQHLQGGNKIFPLPPSFFALFPFSIFDLFLIYATDTSIEPKNGFTSRCAGLLSARQLPQCLAFLYLCANGSIPSFVN
jgi:hypothetical protein